jgi:hypothetical protein
MAGGNGTVSTTGAGGATPATTPPAASAGAAANESNAAESKNPDLSRLMSFHSINAAPGNPLGKDRQR